MCVLAMVVAMAGCGESPTPPNEAVQNYLDALGSGNYVNACSLLDARATQTLLRSKTPHTTCANLFRTCLPHKTLILNTDQTQLYYANIQVSVTGSDATAAVSGTAVARELKHVSLKNEKTVWKVTGFGEAIDRCRLTHHHPGPRHRPAHKRIAAHKRNAA
jgi:hypothetical protein